MAAVHLHNALLAPDSPQVMSLYGRSSVATSGFTSSDIPSARQFVNVHQVPRMPYSYNKRAGERFRRSSRIWFYAMILLSFALLVWVTYCTVRYYVALRVYNGDSIRSRYALGMGIASTLSMLFFASRTLSILWLSDGRCHRWLTLISLSLTYLSSALVMSLAIINLILVLRWRTPHGASDSGRSIQGRCNWDLDVVWSGTGGSCDESAAMPFGDWLGAAVSRLAITILLLVAYHLAVHGHLAAARSHETLPAMIFAGAEDFSDNFQPGAADTTRGFGSSGEFHMRESSQGTFRGAKYYYTPDVESPHRSLSFTQAGQVLSRIEGSEFDEDGNQEDASSSNHDLDETNDSPPSPNFHDTPLPRSESPETLPINEIPPQTSHVRRHWSTGVEALPHNLPPSSYHRPMVPFSSDLQDFTPEFRGLISRMTRETQEGMALNDVPSQEDNTVLVVGSCISRLSTIESIASREISNSLRSPSRADTVMSFASGSPPPSHPGSRNISRNPTLNRGRDRDEVADSPLSITHEA